MFGLTQKEEKLVIFWIKGEGQSTRGLVSVHGFEVNFSSHRDK